MVVCGMIPVVRKRKKKKSNERAKEDCCEDFREMLRQAVGGCEVLPDDCLTATAMIRQTVRKVFGASYGQKMDEKETSREDRNITK